jgi:hypothetical protein
MIAWLLPILSKYGLPILNIVWHAIRRFWSVFLVGLVIVVILMKFNAFKLNLYNEGYKKGYSQALTDHPTYGSVGTINNLLEKFKYAGVHIKLLFLDFKVGK